MLAEVVKGKKSAKGAATDGKANKANTKLSKTTKFDARNEWEEVYGGGEGDEEWSKEEWDEWEKQDRRQTGRSPRRSRRSRRPAATEWPAAPLASPSPPP
ncbi:unnamed protein product [Prorocentrum cordatum]|uniref:Uncharacterized protein n=1 Tax=Prorocentrum cordatum TaxID=2364126 RepID=A0ABN9PVB5_9DINO|nr:unnamed protein product [Polarella glacialis]